MGDVRFAWRSLRKHPGFAAVALVTLAIGIGSATAIFSVLNAVILRPLPYSEPDRLVIIRDSLIPKLPEFSVSPGRFLEWQTRTRAFDGLAATQTASVNLTGSGDPERLRAALVTANVFEVLGASPLIGQAFAARDEADPSRADSVVLSEALWRGRFGAAPNIIGRTVALDDTPSTVIGVMPASVTFPANTTQIWLLKQFSPDERHRYGSHYMAVVGRMKRGATVEQARADLARAAREIEPIEGNKGWTTLLFPMLDFYVRGVRAGLWVLSGAVAFVLLIACANVANLLLARGAGRARELGVRAALGATRGRLAVQMFVENGLLGLVGSLAGLALAWAILQLVVSSQQTGLPRLATIHLDGPTLVCALLLAAATPIIFGVIPTLHVTRANLSAITQQGGRTGASTLGARTRAALIVAEVALAVMLVAGSTLLMRSFTSLVRVSPGFEGEHALMVPISLPDSRYGDDERRMAFFRSLTERIAAVPGVDRAALMQPVPFVSDSVSTLSIPGQTSDDPTLRPSANFYAVSPGIFQAMGIPLLRGRDILPTDGPTTPMVSVISKTLADRYFPNEDPIGKRLQISQGPRGDELSEIVGVVGDVKQYALDMDTTLQVYQAARQHAYFGTLTLIVRSSADPERLTSTLRTAVRELDPALPVASARTLESVVESSVGSRRFTTTLLTGFAIVALLLSAIGVYGLVAFSVGQRTQEIGIRVALGSSPGRVMRLVFRQGLGLTLAGAMLGLLGGLLAARLLDSLLFSTSQHDPLAFVVAPLTLVVAAVAACYFPARRAMRVDPVSALRAQ